MTCHVERNVFDNHDSLPMSDNLLALFRQTGALLDGHFILRSGLHSRQFFQCALLLQHTDIAALVCGQLADKLRDLACDTVISPALGGIIVGQEVGRSLGKRHNFAEKEAGGLVLRPGPWRRRRADRAPALVPCDVARMPARIAEPLGNEPADPGKHGQLDPTSATTGSHVAAPVGFRTVLKRARRITARDRRCSAIFMSCSPPA